MAKKAARSRARATVHSRVQAPPAEAAKPSGFLIAVELGGQWPAVALEGCERRVLVQLEGEAPSAFADRVTQSLDSLFARGVELSHLALACNERLDPDADEARRTLVSLALGAMAPRHAGQVLLTAAATSSERLRKYLSGLADGARREWQSAGLEVTAHFAREAPSAPPVAARARVA